MALEAVYACEAKFTFAEHEGFGGMGPASAEGGWGSDPPNKIAFFGGSFSPPHLGHVAMAGWILKTGQVDAVWVVPCLVHPFGKKLEPFAHRLAMCRLAFGPLAPRVRVLDVEKKLGGKSFTYRTLSHLQRENPDKRFFLVVGQDSARELDRWEQAAGLRQAVEGVIVIPRGSTSPVPGVSATEVRRRLKTGGNLEELLPKAVIEYIVGRKLYK